MSNLEVLKVRVENAEADIKRHEILIERITDVQSDMKKGLAEVATELKITNTLIEKSMAMQQKLIMGLLALIASTLGVGMQVIG